MGANSQVGDGSSPRLLDPEAVNRSIVRTSLKIEGLRKVWQPVMSCLPFNSDVFGYLPTLFYTFLHYYYLDFTTIT